MEMSINMEAVVFEPEAAAYMELGFKFDSKAGLGYKTVFYAATDTEVTKSFSPIRSSNVTRLSISATNLVQGGRCYDPDTCGAQHSEIWRTILSLSPPAENPSPHSSQSHRDSVVLLYDADERGRSIPFDIKSHGADYRPGRTRSLCQKLRLSSASWRPKENRRSLPHHWFNFLGDSMHASALLEQHRAKFRVAFGASGEPIFMPWYATASISFQELSLPSSRSLR
jgi:hypothetical protein